MGQEYLNNLPWLFYFESVEGSRNIRDRRHLTISKRVRRRLEIHNEDTLVMARFYLASAMRKRIQRGEYTENTMRIHVWRCIIAFLENKLHRGKHAATLHNP